MDTRALIKTFFEKNDFPTEAQFSAWLDSIPFFLDDEAPQLQITTVTEAQIKAWFTTPITIVPAQGANSSVDILKVTAKNKFNTTAYTIPAFSRLEIHETNLAGADISSFQATFVSSGVSIVEKPTPDLSFLVQSENVDIVSAYTVGNPTLGDGEIELHTLFSVSQF